MPLQNITLVLEIGVHTYFPRLLVFMYWAGNCSGAALATCHLLRMLFV